MEKLLNIPTWDLSDLYSSIKSGEISKDLEKINKDIKLLSKRYKNKIELINAQDLHKAINLYEQVQEKLHKIYSYIDLVTSENLLDIGLSNKAYYIKEVLDEYSSKIIFFKLEINKIPSEKIYKLSQNKEASKYIQWVKNIQIYKNYQLNEDLERLFLEKKTTGKNAWVRLFDETLASIEIKKNEKTYNLDKALDLMASSHDEKLRKSLGVSISEEFDKRIDLFTFITNTMIKDKEIEDRWRNFSEVDSSRHVSNHIQPEVVECLFASVKEFYPRISHRYYNKKREWIGKSKLNFWDRNVDLGFTKERVWSWNEAKEFVLAAFEEFSPTLANIGKLFFQNDWIDAVPRKGKMSGAFSHQTVPESHPYILMNFYGSNRDVMTLAHELGHGVHQILANEQGLLLSDTPLILAETASVFGEQLVFQSLLKSCSNKHEKKQILSNKIEDMINTVIRQVSFYDFEKKIHNKRRKNELTKDEISNMWLESQKESLGDAFQLGNGYKNFWCYISHFIHSPFYVYSYAFGDGLVNSLFQVYTNNFDGFEATYIKLLKAGGSKSYKELIKMFNLDATTQEFWYKGLEVIENLIDDLEELDTEIK